MTRTAPPPRSRTLLRTHAWLVLLATVVAVGAAAAVALTRPLTYTATAEVVVSPQETGSTALRPDMGTERAIAESGVVVDRAATALHTDSGHARQGLSVSVVLESLVLRISYSASTPPQAQDGATAFADAYVAFRNVAAADRAATLVTSPALPQTGSRGSLAVFLALGLVGGLGVGAGAAWAWDRASGRLRNSEELHRLSGLTVLTRLPRWGGSGEPLPRSGPGREAFSQLAARLTTMAGHGGSGRTVVVTAPRAAAGATTVACGVAVAMAAQGKQVVLVAASPDGLRADQVLGVTTSPGLSQLLSRGCSPELALHPTRYRDLNVVPMGEVPGGRLVLEDVHIVLERLEKHAYVVIDAPPLLDSADALLLADAADLVVLVGDFRAGRRGDVRDALALLDDVSPRLAGWVANRPPRRGWRPPAEPETVQPADAMAPAQAAQAADGQDPADEVTPAPRPRAVRRQPGMKPPGPPRTATPRLDDDLPSRETAGGRGRP
jgi:Mrp family chromosome partitioning ATPase